MNRPLIRNSRPKVFYDKSVLKIFSKFTGKHLCQSPFFNKVAGLRPATLFKKRIWQRCFPVNFAKISRTPFSPGDCFYLISIKLWRKKRSSKNQVIHIQIRFILFRQDNYVPLRRITRDIRSMMFPWYAYFQCRVYDVNEWNRDLNVNGHFFLLNSWFTFMKFLLWNKTKILFSAFLLLVLFKRNCNEDFVFLYLNININKIYRFCPTEYPEASQDLGKYLRWRALQQYLTAKAFKLFQSFSS